MGGRAVSVDLTEAERLELMSLSVRRNTSQALALRARIVLACADGEQNKRVAAALDVDVNTVGKWRRRFAAHRTDGLQDEPRSGAPRTIDDARIEATIVRTLESLPPGAALEFAWHGSGLRIVGFDGAAGVAHLRVAAASAGDVQAVVRPGLRRKGARCRGSLCRAASAGAPCAWVLADALYGSDSRLRRMLEGRRQPYVLAVRSNHTLRMLTATGLLQTDPA